MESEKKKETRWGGKKGTHQEITLSHAAECLVHLPTMGLGKKIRKETSWEAKKTLAKI